MKKKLFKNKKWNELNQKEKYMRIASYLIGVGVVLMIGALFPPIIIYTIFCISLKVIINTTIKIKEIEALELVDDDEEKEYNKEQLKRLCAIIGIILSFSLLVLIGQGAIAVGGGIIYYFIDKKRREKEDVIDINSIKENTTINDTMEVHES